MTDLLKVVFSLSLSGTVVFFVILALGRLCRHRLCKTWQYYIWLVVVVRMLLPFSPEAALLDPVFRQLDGLDAGTVQTTAPIQQPAAAPDTEDSYRIPATEPQPPALSVSAIALTVYKNLWMVWVGVALALLIRKITLYQSFVRFLKAGRAEVSDIETLNLLATVGEAVGVKRPVELYTHPLISSPMLLGVFRPCILLPGTGQSQTELAYILRHELTHYRRLDIFYKWLVQLTVCLHWFNPFVYLMAKEVSKCCELACDEAVIRTLDKEERKAYGDTLLHALAATGQYRDKLAAITLTEGAEQLKERLESIVKFKEISMPVRFVTVVLTALLCIGATAAGAYAAVPNAGPPLLAAGAPEQSYSYSQQGYYQGDYIFELGWNWDTTGNDAYPDRVTLPLADRAAIAVAFDSDCKEQMQQPAVLASLTELLQRLQTQHAGSANPLEHLFVSSIAYVGDSDLVALAEEYYAEGALTKFSSIFPLLDSAVQKAYCTRMIEDGKNTFLSSTAKQMEPELLDYCVEKTYQEDALSLFSALVPHLTDAQTDEWAVRASRDDKNTFFAVLAKRLAGSTATATEDTGDTKKRTTREESLVESFAPFRSYGLVYDAAQDRVFWNGQEVKAFVDIRGMLLGESYSFDLCYTEPDSDSTLHLMAVRDDNRTLTGIAQMPEELRTDLFDLIDLYDKAPPTQSDNAQSQSRGGQAYVVFDATTFLHDSTITATDKLGSADIPKAIADWILTCQGTDKVYVNRTTTDGKVEGWIYYDSDTRMGWQMHTDGTTIKVTLTGKTPTTMDGGTLIHYQAPASYIGLEVYLNSERLAMEIQ